MDLPDCPGCTRTVRLAPGEVDRILSDYFKDNPVKIADKKTYAIRLQTCDTCPDFQYGTTCRHCGCLVAVRAKIADQSCPAPSPKW